MTRPTSAAPAWLLEDLARFYAPMLGTVSHRLDVPASGSMAAARARRIAGHDVLEVRQHAAAVLARRGTGLAVELLDGRRGWIDKAWEPVQEMHWGAESVRWRTIRAEPLGRDFMRAASAARGRDLAEGEAVRAAAVVVVQLFGSGDLVMVEVERVRIPAPSSADVDGFMQRKRSAGWKRPRPTMPADYAIRAPRRGSEKIVGIGSRVAIGGPNGRRGVVIDAAPGGWWVQLDDGELIGHRAAYLHNLGPIQPEVVA